MTVRPVDILVVVAALGVVLFVALLPSPRDNNPAVPDTAEHRGLRTEGACLRCHAAGAAQPLRARHPSRMDCFRCHRTLSLSLPLEGEGGVQVETWGERPMVKVLVMGPTLQQLVEDPEVDLEIDGQATVQTLFDAHAEKLSGLLPLLKKGEIMVTVNRKVGALTSTVKDGDTIKLTHNFNPTFDGAMWHNP